MIFTPHDYQQDIIDAVRSQNVLVNAVMGAGKTAPVIEAVRVSKAPVLVIAPLRVAEHTWPAEIAKWENFKGVTHAVCTGSLKRRMRALQASVDILIVNKENVPWLVAHYAAAWPFRVVVVDESSAFKSHSTKRFKALKRVRKLIRRMVLLSGTPTPNSIMDIWSQAFLLDGGERLGTAFTRFREKYFVSDYMGYNWTARDGAEQEITSKMADLWLRVEKYDGLPERVDLVEEVSLPPGAADVYRTIERDAYAELMEVEITAVNAAVVAGKLLQVASGAVYDDSGTWQHVHDAKIEALASLLEQAEGENVLVAYNYKHEIERIRQAFPEAVSIKDDGAIDAWCAGEVRLMLAHPASAGHGLNLWSGGHRIIWFSPTWSNELKQQFDARLHRQGQTMPVFVHTIVSHGTMDERVMDAVAHKRSVQEMVMEQMQRSKAA